MCCRLVATTNIFSLIFLWPFHFKCFCSFQLCVLPFSFVTITVIGDIMKGEKALNIFIIHVIEMRCFMDIDVQAIGLV